MGTGVNASVIGAGDNYSLNTKAFKDVFKLAAALREVKSNTRWVNSTFDREEHLGTCNQPKHIKGELVEVHADNQDDLEGGKTRVDRVLTSAFDQKDPRLTAIKELPAKALVMGLKYKGAQDRADPDREVDFSNKARDEYRSKIPQFRKDFGDDGVEEWYLQKLKADHQAKLDKKEMPAEEREAEQAKIDAMTVNDSFGHRVSVLFDLLKHTSGAFDMLKRVPVVFLEIQKFMKGLIGKLKRESLLSEHVHKLEALEKKFTIPEGLFTEQALESADSQLDEDRTKWINQSVGLYRDPVDAAKDERARTIGQTVRDTEYVEKELKLHK